MLWRHETAPRLDPPQPLGGAIDQIDSEQENEDAEGKPKVRPDHFVGEVGPEPSTKEHRGGQDQRGADIDIPVPVVFQCGTQANRGEEDREAGAGGFVLGEACPVNQGRDNDNATADPKQSGRDPSQDPNLNEGEP